MVALLVAVALVGASPQACHIERDARGHIRRSSSARRVFKITHPCPGTGATSGSCKGYVVDHICPLACCGADTPSNMQWQTTAESRAKDAWELNCSSCPR
jgi:hypothetical protein